MYKRHMKNNARALVGALCCLVGGALTGCGDDGGEPAGATCTLAGPATPQIFRDRASFDAALKVTPRIINFDDVDATAGAVRIASDHYANLGAILVGTDGQYVGQDFEDPGSLVPSSAPNGFAPGPKAAVGAANGTGGHETDVTFVAGGNPACVAGFGAQFIDVDFPSMGPSSLTAFSAGATEIGKVTGLSGRDAEAVFAGIIFFDDATGLPVPAISRVHIVNGNSWPGVDAGEGVMLDDFVFAAPVAP